MFVPVRAVRVALAAAAALTLLAFARDARAGWSADPVEVYPTTAACPLVAACNDGARGAIVVWQQNASGASGVLVARHLLATGDVDPAWPALASVCATSASRAALGAVADGLGGAYVWWQVGASLYLTRVAPDGSLAAGWPAGGRVLGSQFVESQRLNVIADGAHGVYASWNQLVASTPWEVRFMLAHLGPANTAAGGFPPGAVRAIGTTTDQTEWACTSAIGLAPDGGVWAAWGTAIDTGDALVAGDDRLVHLTSAGLPAAGWDARGVVLGVYPADALNMTTGWLIAPGMALVGVASDGGDGAYFVRADVSVNTWPDFLDVKPRLFHVGGSGAIASGWPAAGITPGTWGLPATFDNGATASFRAIADGTGGVFAGQPAYASEFTSAYTFARYGADGASRPGEVGADQLGLEFAPRGDGGLFVASFYPSGPTSSWSPNAYVGLRQSSPGSNWIEWHDTPVVEWYGDEALASLGDGSALLAWSQVNVRHGIYAVRVNAAGLVTDVAPGASAAVSPRLALHFARGAGVTAFASLPAAGRASVVLADVAGRVLARRAFDAAAGANAWTLAGTEALAPGVYFARVESGALRLAGKVAVVR